MSATLTALVVVALAVAGCTGAGPASTSPSPGAPATERPVQFVTDPWSEREGDRIVWHVLLVNGDDAVYEGLSLHASVAFKNAPAGTPPDTVARPLPRMPSGAQMEFTVDTPYHGLGDYEGPIEVWHGQTTMDNQFLWYEDCGPC
jgi:hypothetical protein